jgi:hypothetical protein
VALAAGVGAEGKVPVGLAEARPAARRDHRVVGLMLAEVVIDLPLAAPTDRLGKGVEEAVEIHRYLSQSSRRATKPIDKPFPRGLPV